MGFDKRNFVILRIREGIKSCSFLMQVELYLYNVILHLRW
jgi:hypothetical protein